MGLGLGQRRYDRGPGVANQGHERRRARDLDDQDAAGPAEPMTLGPWGQADFSRGVRRAWSRGTSVGLTFSSTASAVLTTRSTSLRLRASYHTGSRDSPGIRRSPPAPGPPTIALSATALSASSGDST